MSGMFSTFQIQQSFFFWHKWTLSSIKAELFFSLCGANTEQLLCRIVILFSSHFFVLNVTYVWSTAQKCMNYRINKHSDVMSSGLCDAAGRMPGTCRSVWFPTMPPHSARNPTVSSRPAAAAETPPRGSCNTDSLSESVHMCVLVWETGLSTHRVGVLLVLM